MQYTSFFIGLLSLGIGFVLIPLGMMVFKQAEYYAKKTGKLKRSG